MQGWVAGETNACFARSKLMELNGFLTHSNALNIRLSHNLITQSRGDRFCEYINNWQFCNIYNLHSLCHKSSRYKNPEKLSCIDLFLANSPRSFQNTQTIETGLSEFHKLVITILKMHLPNNQPKVITYRDYKNFDNSRFFWGVAGWD